MNTNFKIYVSLTTIPCRFKNIYPCIDSLLNQLFLPTKIVINLPITYNFRFGNTSISEEDIQEFNQHYSHTDLIKIIRTSTDYGPGTKLVGILKNKVPLDNSFIILVDDDVIYKNNFLQGFIPYLYEKSVASYWIYEYSDIIIGQGVDGFLIHGELLKDFLNYYKIIKNEKYINYQDDVFISFFMKIKGITINKVNSNETIYDNYNNCEALSNLDGNFSRDLVYSQCIHLLNEYNNKGNFHFLQGKENI
jgi:hypothetical protein